MRTSGRQSLPRRSGSRSNGCGSSRTTKGGKPKRRRLANTWRKRSGGNNTEKRSQRSRKTRRISCLPKSRRKTRWLIRYRGQNKRKLTDVSAKNRSGVSNSSKRCTAYNKRKSVRKNCASRRFKRKIRSSMSASKTSAWHANRSIRSRTPYRCARKR